MLLSGFLVLILALHALSLNIETGGRNLPNQCRVPRSQKPFNCPCNGDNLEPCKGHDVVCVRGKKQRFDNIDYTGTCQCKFPNEKFAYGGCYPTCEDGSVPNPFFCAIARAQESGCFAKCFKDVGDANNVPVCQALCHNTCLQSQNNCLTCCPNVPLNSGQVYCCEFGYSVTQLQCNAAAATEANCFAKCSTTACKQACKETCLSSSCADCCPANFPTVCGAEAVPIADCLQAAATEATCAAACIGTAEEKAICQQGTCKTACIQSTCTYTPSASCDDLNCCPLPVETFCGAQLTTGLQCKTASDNEDTCFTQCALIFANSPLEQSLQAICQAQCKAVCLAATCPTCCPNTVKTFCAGEIDGPTCFESKSAECACYDKCAEDNPQATFTLNTAAFLNLANCQTACKTACLARPDNCAECCPNSAPIRCNTPSPFAGCNAAAATATLQACYTACVMAGSPFGSTAYQQHLCQLKICQPACLAVINDYSVCPDPTQILRTGTPAEGSVTINARQCATYSANVNLCVFNSAQPCNNACRQICNNACRAGFKPSNAIDCCQ